MAKTSVFWTLSKEKQDELVTLADALSCFPELLMPPEIIDDDLHEKYLKEIENGADPNDIIDEGVYQRIDTKALTALIGLLQDLRRDAVAADECFANVYKEKERMNKTSKGKNSWLHKKIVCLETEETFNSIKEASEKMNIKYKYIQKVLQNNSRNKSTFGYHFSYTENK